jgi:uncharacterized protein YdaU (DUF1376 family)
MSNAIWYARYVGDYQKKTAHLSIMQHGAYCLLLDWVYANQKPLPANAVQLHRICRAFDDAERDAIEFVLQEFFELTPKGFINKRALEEIERQESISEKRRNAALARYSKPENKQKNDDANAPANAVQKHTQSQSQSQSQLNTQSDLLNISKDILPQKPSKKSKPAPKFSDQELNTCFDLFNDFAVNAGLPTVQNRSPERKAHIIKRLEECGGLKGWEIALENCKKSGFLLGENDRGWVMTFDFMVKKEKFSKIMEGDYLSKNPKQKTQFDQFMQDTEDFINGKMD